MKKSLLKGCLFSVLLYTCFVQAMGGFYCIKVGDQEKKVPMPGVTMQDMKRSFITVNVADDLFGKEQWSKALTYYQQALESKALPPMMRAQVLMHIAKIFTIGDAGTHPVKLNYKKALTSLQEAAEIQNVPDKLLAVVHKHIGLISTIGGYGVEPDFLRARRSYQRFLDLTDVADARRASTLFFLGKNCYFGGCGAGADHKKAIECYSEAMALGQLDAEAHETMHCHLGSIYAAGAGSNVSPDYAKAFKHFYFARSSTNLYMMADNVFACINRVMSEYGHTIPLKLNECAAMHYNLGRIFYRGGGCFEKNWPQAIRFFHRATCLEADKRLQAKDHYYIGKAMYFGADDLKKDWAHAYQHFHKVLKLKTDKDMCSRAHKYIASMFTHGGSGIKQDQKKALLHWRSVLKTRDAQDYTAAVAHISLGALYARKSLGEAYSPSKALAHLRHGNVSQAGGDYQKYAQCLIAKLEKKVAQ